MTCPDVPIGVFDSGVGGLTVARAITDQLPHEWLHYVGDTIPGPYGSLPIAQIRSLARAGRGRRAGGKRSEADGHCL